MIAKCLYLPRDEITTHYNRPLTANHKTIKTALQRRLEVFINAITANRHYYIYILIF